MQFINALLESEETKTLISENEQIVNDTVGAAEGFKEELKTFVLANPGEFVAESLAETIKNINVFVEAAVAQYLTEVTSFNSNFIKAKEEIVENELSDYI
jgi:molybdopterin-guanine dinucleotide biosynthesis protein